MLNTDILSARETADALHLSIQYVRNLISAGDLASVKIEGRRYVTQASVDAYYSRERRAKNAERARLRRVARRDADRAYRAMPAEIMTVDDAAMLLRCSPPAVRARLSVVDGYVARADVLARRASLALKDTTAGHVLAYDIEKETSSV